MSSLHYHHYKVSPTFEIGVLSPSNTDCDYQILFRKPICNLTLGGKCVNVATRGVRNGRPGNDIIFQPTVWLVTVALVAP